MARLAAAAFDKDQQFEEKRRAVIVAAAHAFHERGYTDTSLDEIAQRLNVTKKTLYYYVENKAAILLELFNVWLDTQAASIAHAEQTATTPLARLEAYTRHYIHSVLQLSAPIDRVANEITRLSSEEQALINKRRSANDQRVRNFIRGGIKDGSIRDVDVKFAHYTLHGAIDWFFKYYDPNGAMPADAIIGEVLKVLFLGLKKVRR